MEQVSSSTTRQQQEIPAILALRGAVADDASTLAGRFARRLLHLVRKGRFLASLFTLLALSGLNAAQAASVQLNVVTGRDEPAAFDGLGAYKGDPVVEFKYIINVDNTGTTEQRSPLPGSGCSPQDAGYPGSCHWTSIAGAKAASPVFTQGNQDDFYASAAGLEIPPGRYLISVLADGYKLDGQHFTVDAANNVIVDGVNVAGMVTVILQPTPLPDAQIQAAVFEDVSPVNSAPDLPAEHGLAG